MSGALRSYGPSRQASTNQVGTGSGTTSSLAATAPLSSSAAVANQFRRLVWEATIPVSVHVEASDLASGSDKSIETYFTRSPRVSYLPLLLEELRKNFLPMLLEESVLNSLGEKDYWFSHEGVPLRWHWPIGLLYDYHTTNTAPSAHRSSSSAREATSSFPRRSSHQIEPEAFLGGFSAGPSPIQHQPPLPWRLTLRLKGAPLDKIHSAPGLNSSRSSFMSMLKEADFVRYGSTKRVTNLRKSDQDQLWEGVVSHDFDTYWSVASKLVPPVPSAADVSQGPSRTPSMSSLAPNNGENGGGDRSFNTVSSTATARPSLTQQFNESQTSLATSMHSTATSEAQSLAPSVAESQTTSRAGSSGGAGSSGTGPTSKEAVRSVPMRFHLIDGAPVVQEPVAPFLEDGRSMTLHMVLSALFPLLFPPTPTFSTGPQGSQPPPVAYAVIQGIRIPLEAEVHWIGSALPSADGWVAVCINLLVEGEKPDVTGTAPLATRTFT